MAFSYRKDTFTKNTATGNQAVTGVGFQPKALILFTDRQTATGFTDTCHFSIGYTDGTTSRCLAMCSDDNAASSNAGRANGKKVIIILSDGSPTVGAAANIVSFDADGFTIDWTTNEAVSSIVHYIAFGGDDLTNAKVNVFTANTATGNQAVTGVGFQPDFVMFLCKDTTGDGAQNTGSHGIIGMGYGVSSTKRGALCTTSEDGRATMDTWRFQRADRCILQLTKANGSIDAEADLVSLDSDGFTINWIDAPGSADKMFYMALKGGQYDVGSFNQKTSTGTQAVTGVGFTPTGLILSGRNAATTTTSDSHNRISFGSSDATREGCNWIGDQDAAANSITARAHVTTKIIRHATEAATGSSSTTDAEADLTSFDSDGFTLDWTTADATAREIIYTAFGSTAVAVGAPEFMAAINSPLAITNLETTRRPQMLMAMATEKKRHTRFPPLFDIFDKYKVWSVLFRSILVTDSGSGTDALKLDKPLIISTDTGSGSDALLIDKLLMLVADSGSGIDTAFIDKKLMLVADSGSGSDTQLIDKLLMLVADSGSGSDALKLDKPLVISSDSGSGTEQLLINKPLLTVADSGAGTDTTLIDKLLMLVTDSGSGVDTPLIDKLLLLIADSGSGAEALLITKDILLPETGTGTDALKLDKPLIITTDSGSGTDQLLINKPLTKVTDTGLGTDVLKLDKGLVLITDSGTGSEVITVVELAPAAGTHPKIHTRRMRPPQRLKPVDLEEELKEIVEESFTLNIFSTITKVDSLILRLRAKPFQIGSATLNIKATPFKIADVILKATAKVIPNFIRRRLTAKVYRSINMKLGIVAKPTMNISFKKTILIRANYDTDMVEKALLLGLSKYLEDEEDSD